MRLQVLEARAPSDFAGAFSAMTKERARGVIVLTSSMFYHERTRIAELAARSRLPAIYSVKEFAEAGGLMAYGVNLGESFRRAATYVDKILKDWACECLFFFNYNRINPGINNPLVAPHMEALFGAPRLAALRADVQKCSPAERQVLVMAALTDALKALGARYVVPFRFKMDDADRTSHYLVFVSKNFLGYEIMRDVMAKASSYGTNGVPSFEYNPTPPLFFPDGRTVEALAESLTVDLAGRTMTVGEVFERHSPSRLYVKRNYKEALMRLEAAGRVVPSRPIAERRKGTLADNITITFPRRPGSGARLASRSTPARQGAGLPPSASVRPTA